MAAAAADVLATGRKKNEFIMIIWDFDRTLIMDDDSDRWVVVQMGLMELFNHLRQTLPWNSLMDRMMEELHSQGKTIEDIINCLKRVPLHPQIVSAIKSAHAQGCDLKVLSDANRFFIETILKNHGFYDCFSEIITNPTVVDKEGRLRIFPYHGHKLTYKSNKQPIIRLVCFDIANKRRSGLLYYNLYPRNMQTETASSHEEKYQVRKLEIADKNKGFMELLQQLTVCDPVSDEVFQKRFEEFKSYGDDHIICVIEDVSRSKIVATGSVFIEKKFVRSCGKAGHIECM